MNDVLMKRCTKCGQEYPATAEYWFRKLVNKNGLKSRCKECCGYKFTPPALPVREGCKRCTKCGIEHPATTEHFYSDSHRHNKDGLRPYCKLCTKAQHTRYRTENPDKAHELYIHYRLENPDKERLRRARYRAENRDKVREINANYRAKNVDKLREQGARYRADNPDKKRAQTHRRLARKKGLPTAPIDENRMLEYFNGCCAVCGRPPGLWHTLALDHWIPLTDPRPDNPGTVPTNLIPLCHSKKGANGQGSCNQSKFNKDPERWLIEQYGKRRAAKILARIEAYFESIRH